VRIRLTVDDRELQGLLDGLKAGEARFAMAKSLTQTAKLAQPRVRGDLPQSFTIRNDWVSRGIRIEPATKERLEAAVGSKDAFMRMQAEGGTKTPKRRALAIPVGARDPQSKLTKRSDWPKALLRQRNRYFLASSRRTRVLGLFEDRGPGQEPRLMYHFAPRARVRPRWDLWGPVNETVRREYPAILRRNVEEEEVRREARRRGRR
jgi:hypothetical protein